MNEYSLRIKTLIEESGLGYAEIERLTGVPKSNLQRYASGRTSKIPLDVVEKLSALFNVSPSYIMGWVEEQKKPTVIDDGLSNSKTELMNIIRIAPDDKVAMILRVVKSVLQED